MTLVCFDTQIIIWGVQGAARPSQQGMVQKTQLFLNQLNETKVRIMIPSIVIAEFLMAIPFELHFQTSSLFQKKFIIEPFDLQAASKFAQIWQDKNQSGKVKQIKQELNLGKQELKADCMIVAIAVAKGADCIYSHDSGLKKFAEGTIEVREIPDTPQQLPLSFD